MHGPSLGRAFGNLFTGLLVLAGCGGFLGAVGIVFGIAVLIWK
ncbi:hypothetical protein VT84_33160 [Gemmata sp. SH-PL17]|nr:hypothetical protein [Gemmata sp. SH-PL17]AMV29292.1 hypothetical protein VT84_33160 [Gemmata sp. SH-PL17]